MGRGDRRSMPRSRQALQGSQRLNPARSRLPLPWVIAAAIAHKLVEMGHAAVALVTVVAFHAYLRPGVAAAVVPSQVTPPLQARKAGEAQLLEHRWCLNLHPAEWETPSKTGTWDETVELCEADSRSKCT